MKKKNCNCEYLVSRNSELRREFINRLGGNWKNINEIFMELSSMPASRFYISEERAYALLKVKIRRGKWHPDILPRCREMMEEIYRRVNTLMDSDSSLSLKDAVFDVVNSPAPGFYLSPRSIRTILYRYLKAG